MKRIQPVLLLLIVAGLSACDRGGTIEKTPASAVSPARPAGENLPATQPFSRMDPLMQSDDEWKKHLSPQQCHVMFEKGTEQAFSGKYNHWKKDGVFVCAACKQPLFDSTTKFDSGTGWPSFYTAITEGNVRMEIDRSHGMVRTEVQCARCGGHLGHIFDDGPQPTGLRYCINSVALAFQPRNGDAEE